MGELIVHGLKVVLLVIACIAVTAAVLILFNVIVDLISGFSLIAPIAEVFGLFSIFMPIKMNMVLAVVTALMSWKAGWWVANKLMDLSKNQ